MSVPALRNRRLHLRQRRSRTADEAQYSFRWRAAVAMNERFGHTTQPTPHALGQACGRASLCVRAFEELGIERIELRVHPGDTAAGRCRRAARFSFGKVVLAGRDEIGLDHVLHCKQPTLRTTVNPLGDIRGHWPRQESCPHDG